VSCVEPIPFETLVDLWARELADHEAECVEEHIFTCDSCAATSAQLDRLLGSLLYQVPPVITRGLRDRLEQRGLKILDMAFEPGARGEAFFAADLDLLVFTLRAELANAQRVDLEVADSDGQVFYAFTAVPFDAAHGEVLVACQQHFRHYLHIGDPEFRVYAVEAGTRRRVGSYVIKHIWPPL
jgi:hypothetical protein